jgi:hypothetical protein
MLTSARQKLVTDAEDAHRLDRLAAKLVIHYDVRLHAAYWGRERADLLIEVGHFPIWDAMRFFSSTFAQQTQARRGYRGSLLQPYRSALVLSDEQFLLLVRHIHQMPYKELQRPMEEYPYSSYHGYIDKRAGPWHTRKVLALLAKRQVCTKEERARWMAKPVSEAHSALFDTTTGILPSRTAEAPESLLSLREKSSAASAEDEAGKALDPRQIEPIITVVGDVLDLTPEQIRSRDSTQNATRARALVAWTGLRKGLGSRTAFAGYLGGRSCSTIDRAIDRYRHEELFRLTFEQLEKKGRERRMQRQKA